MTNFGEIANYASFVEQDPFRNGLHYPAVLDQLQLDKAITRRRILDIGCGDGCFDRIMAAQGASVTGYDMAPEKIAEARAAEKRNPLGISYQVATPESFFDLNMFNNATSVLVLPYAPSVEELRAFFQSASRHILEKGKFISVIFNPAFKAFGKDLGSRRFNKFNGNDVQVEFIDPKNHTTQFTSVLHQYSRADYERVAMESGLHPECFGEMYATREAIRQMGEDFWAPVHDEQSYSLFVAGKSK